MRPAVQEFGSFHFRAGTPGPVPRRSGGGQGTERVEEMFGKWKSLFHTEKAITIMAPVSGTVVPLSKVADPTFAQCILGKGAAIIPGEGRIVAPADGTIDLMFETGHAVSMTTGDGAEVLIHVGLDTVRLRGKHYRVLCQSGDKVTRGQTLIEFDPEAIRAEGYDTVTPVIVCNTEAFSSIHVEKNSEVAAGEVLLTLHKQQ